MAVTTALYRLPPVEYLAGHTFFFKQGEITLWSATVGTAAVRSLVRRGHDVRLFSRKTTEPGISPSLCRRFLKILHYMDIICVKGSLRCRARHMTWMDRREQNYKHVRGMHIMEPLNYPH